MTGPLPRDILAGGSNAVNPLPTAEQFSALSRSERHVLLDGWRAELYGVASVVAERTVQRAVEQRPSYPPYGLVRSLFSQLGVVAADPRPYDRGSIAGFEGLGRAYLDTVVFHLARELTALRQSELAWLVERLDQLLALYRLDADKPRQGRIRDPFAFLYGGLHFGTSLCVQLVEVMTRMLAPGQLAADEVVAVLHRSSRVLYQLAAVNIDDIPAVYRHIHGTSSTPWLRADAFVVHREGGRPRRIDLVAPGLGSGSEGRYRTRGCPARSSPSGGPGAITTLWNWCYELAEATGSLASA